MLVNLLQHDLHKVGTRGHCARWPGYRPHEQPAGRHNLCVPSSQPCGCSTCPCPAFGHVSSADGKDARVCHSLAQGSCSNIRKTSQTQGKIDRWCHCMGTIQTHMSRSTTAISLSSCHAFNMTGSSGPRCSKARSMSHPPMLIAHAKMSKFGKQA